MLRIAKSILFFFTLIVFNPSHAFETKNPGLYTGIMPSQVPNDIRQQILHYQSGKQSPNTTQTARKEIRVEFFEEYGPNNSTAVIVESLEDTLTIHDVKVNRGTCYPAPFRQNQFPRTLNFGQKEAFLFMAKRVIRNNVSQMTIDGPCENYREIVLVTNYGTFQYSFD